MIINLNNQSLHDQNQKQVQSQISGVLIGLDNPFENAIINVANRTNAVGGRPNKILLGAGFYPLYRGRH